VSYDYIIHTNEPRSNHMTKLNISNNVYNLSNNVYSLIYNVYNLIYNVYTLIPSGVYFQEHQ